MNRFQRSLARKEAIKLLHAMNPRRWTVATLAVIFEKNSGQIWWLLNDDKRREFDMRRMKEPSVLAKKRKYARELYHAKKNDPAFKASLAKANKRYHKKLREQRECEQSSGLIPA